MALQDTARHVPVRADGDSWFYDPRIRGIISQVVVGGLMVIFIFWIINNTATNLERAGIASGFGFWGERAGFDISQTLVGYTVESSYGRALYIGALNTVLVAITGCFTAIALGFVIGIARLSRNWLIQKLSTVYVEIFRNLPPLLVIFFWYFGVLTLLPNPNQSVELPLEGYLNNRGLIIPRPIFEDGFSLVVWAFAIAVVAIIGLGIWAKRRQEATGQIFPLLQTSIGLVVGLPLLAFLVSGAPLSFEIPEASRFNLVGGIQIKPEFIALYLALSVYTASFIAEIVRAGILAVSHGQTEAAHSLGLRHGPTLRLVVIPQAMRVIIPPLTSQCLNLTKNSSLAVAIGYADLMSVGGTILNQTGQAVEIVVIWMSVYLGLSLLTSAFMNWFNAKMSLVER
ncbi:MAG: amino acid ABC transporter permease [Pseudomonadota bacterium]